MPIESIMKSSAHILIVRFLGAAFIASAMTARADSLTLNAANDTTLFETSAGNNLGGTTNFIAGNTAAGARNRALLRFDIAAQIPVNATINSVSLSLVDSSGSGSFAASTFSLYRVLGNWGEGTKTGNSGQAATAGEATWIYRSATNLTWSAPGAAAGGDYVPTASATNFISVGGVTNVWNSTPALVNDVQTWLGDSGTNFGWILISDGEGVLQSARRFASRENLLGRGPKLMVDFTPAAVPEPGALLLTGLGGVLVLLARVRRSRHSPK